MDDTRLVETEISRERVLHGHIIDVEHWQVRLPNGETALREVIRHPGAAAVLPVDEENRVTLVRQWRAPVGRVTLEIPAGKLNSREEDPLACAQRELSEETGLTARVWRKLTVLESAPALLDERLHLYMAMGLSRGETHPDEDEFVDTVTLPLREAVARIFTGEIREGKTCIALLMADALLRQPYNG